MSFQPALRPWLAAPARSRRLSTEENQQQLETPRDWTDFQVRRADVSTLIENFSQYGSTQNSHNTFQPRDGLHKPASQATISALLASGAHFGHASTRMNPNFMPYAPHLAPPAPRANLVRAVARANGQIVFIGTRPDLRPIVQKAASRLGKQGYHVGDRWLPGTLTNKVQMFGSEVVKEEKITPDLVILLNPLANVNAIRECAIEHVPTIGIIDSNADPRIVMYPIPANDESTRSAELLAGVLSIAGREGVALRVAEEQRQAEKEQKRGQQYYSQDHRRSKSNTYDY
ncbi:ribosomal protein S2, flavodoxin-like domain-containing protein [Infundibulicybe gibba]|nr:ribosomal protein S2, flavodoxin-like domain-containing protein [Infundibulicybe gibba]